MEEQRPAESPAEPPITPPGRRPMDIARRTAVGARKGHNWTQLIQFGLIGASGYVVNLAVFALLAEGAGLHHIPAAIGAFCVAVTNNFFWNRHWTFGSAGEAGFQAPRFFAISLGALVVNLIALELLISAGGIDELPAQALAIAIAMPVNFIGNKIWTFSWDTLE